MTIILRYLFKSIWEKKLRTFLIVLSIVLSTGVFFSSVAISGSLTDMITAKIRGYCGSSDILITRDNKSGSQFLYTQTFDRDSDILEYVIGQVDMSGTYVTYKQEELGIAVHGADLNELQKMNPFSLVKEGDLYPFSGSKIIIDETASNDYNLLVGDWMELNIQGTKHRFVICAIAKASGPFTRLGPQIPAFVPSNYASAMYNSIGMVTTAYAKLKDGYPVKEAADRLADEYKGYRFEETVPLSEIENEMSMISLIFLALSCIVFFMSIFIIYSSFKIITMERLPVIGTFRSIGATRKMTDLILLGESLLYGILGGVLGVLCGIGILYVFINLFTKLISAGSGEISAVISYSPVNMIISFLVAVLLCLISSLAPIIKVSKIPVKDVILNTISKPVKYKNIRLVLGLLLMGMSLATILVKNDKLRPAFGGAGMILSLIAIIVLVPYMTTLFVKAFERIYIVIFGNLGILAAKNLRENKSILNNISMLAIGISSLLLINTIGYNSILSVTDMYKHSNFDALMYYYADSRNTERLIITSGGVEYVYPDFTFYGTEISGRSDRINLRSVNLINFSHFFDIELEDGHNLNGILKKLDEGRNILIPSALQKSLNLKAGDTLKLKMITGTKSYTIIGFYNEILGSKSWGLVSERFLTADMRQKYCHQFYIQGSIPPEELVENLNHSFRRSIPYIRSKGQIIEEYIQNNQQVIMLMQIFSILALIIGTFGVINNLIISFIERKHSIAIFRSIGMSKKQTRIMILIESLSGGLMGGLLGVIGSIVMITVMIGISEDLEVAYPISSFIVFILAGSLVMLVASIGPALKSSRLDLVSSLKYE